MTTLEILMKSYPGRILLTVDETAHACDLAPGTLRTRLSRKTFPVAHRNMVWSYVKYGRLSNYCPNGTSELRPRLKAELSRVRRRPDLLESFFRHTGLSL